MFYILWWQELLFTKIKVIRDILGCCCSPGGALIRLLERSVKNSVKFTFISILLQLHFGDNVSFPHHNKLTTGVSVTFTWAPVSSDWQYLLCYVVVSPLAVLQALIFHSLLIFVMEMSFFLSCLCSVRVC